MPFTKQGDSLPVEKILCSCGGTIIEGKCTKCGKEYTKPETKEKTDEK